MRTVLLPQTNSVAERRAARPLVVAYLDVQVEGGRINPYQRRFYAAVREVGIETVGFPYVAGDPFRALRQVKPDVLHLDWLHSFYAGAGIGVTLAKLAAAIVSLKRRGGCRVVHTTHNLYAHDSKLPRWLERLCISSLLAEVDALMSFNEAAATRFATEFPGARPKARFVVPHGHYIEDYGFPMEQPEARRALGLPSDARIVLFFGSARGNKGLERLLGCFAEVHRRTGALLLLAGGSHRGAPSGGDPQWLTLLPGWVSDAQVAVVFGACDLVVLPYDEGVLSSGAVYLSASMGRPMVLPDVPSSYGDLPRPGLFTYDPRVRDGLLHGLLDAVRSPDLHSRGMMLQSVLLRDHDWRAIGRLAADMYYRMIR